MQNSLEVRALMVLGKRPTATMRQWHVEHPWVVYTSAFVVWILDICKTVSVK